MFLRWLAEAVAAAAFVIVVYEVVVAGALALWPDASDSWILLLWIIAATVSGLGLTRVRRVVAGGLAKVWPATAGRSHTITALTAAAAAVDTDEGIFAEVAALVAAGTGAGAVQVWIAEPARGMRCAGQWPAADALTATSGLDLAAIGELPAVDAVVPVRDGAELLGALTLAGEPRGTLSVHDERLAADAADAVALMLGTMALTSAVEDALRREQDQAASLTRSRYRLVVARDVARARLSTQIQDRVGSTLTHCADDIDRLLAAGAADAGIRRAMTERLDTAIGDFRNIVHGFYPAALADHGIGPCLDDLVTGLPWATTFDGADLPRMDEQVELGVYFCVTTVIDAVRAWPDVRQVDLEVRVDLDALVGVLRVKADSVPIAFSGETSDSVQDRIDALDGEWFVHDESDGVLVRLVIPVPTETITERS